MAGETNLDKMLRTLDPELSEESYVFCQVEEKVGKALISESLGAFREDEGLTLIMPRHAAEENSLDFEFTFRKITLKVYSSLAALGLLAEVTRVLAAKQIAANVISGHDHDHLFVLEGDARRALEALERLSDQARRSRA